jgi:hypothetical protein
MLVAVLVGSDISLERSDHERRARDEVVERVHHVPGQGERTGILVEPDRVGMEAIAGLVETGALRS